MPGTMPAMNSAPTDVLVATAYITITIDGGIRMPSAPEVVMTPAPKRGGKPCLTIAGRMIEPIATTVAGELPDTAANSAQAMTPASPRPPCQWPTIADGEVDHPPRDAAVGEEVAGEDEERDRHDLELLDAGEELQRDRLDRHVVIVNRYVSTVRPSEIEIGIPVSIRPNSSAKMIHALSIGTPASLSTTGIAIRTGGISAGQRGACDGARAGTSGAHGLPPRDRRRMEVGVQRVGAELRSMPSTCATSWCGSSPVRAERPCDLQEAEAHQVRAERDAQVDDPLRQLEVGRHRVGVRDVPDEGRAQRADDRR